jgi:hypothetical protein
MPGDAARIVQSEVAEVALGVAPDDAWAELDVRVTGPDGRESVVPAFARDGRWHLRYSSEELGIHHYTAGDDSGEITVTERASATTVRERGPIRVAADQRRFEHADGTPFLWVGDTWWHGFVTGKIDDDEFRDFARQRRDEGFSVVQIVVLPPEAGAFVDAVRCRAGWAWLEDFAAPNLAWWDDADGRVQDLLDVGIVPCIVGSWGYHLGWMDDRTIRRHWREMVARWGAYPVTWCLAGEPTMVWYDDMRALLDAQDDDGDRGDRLDRIREIGRTAPQKGRFNTLSRVLRELDPFHRPTTTHIIPGEMPWEILDDVDTLDFWMLQTGHSGHRDLPQAVDMVEQAYARTPTKPVINGEPSYEGIGGSNWEDIQRIQFWSHLLSGAAGHTYGAHGVWAMNTDEFPAQYSGAAPTWHEARAFSGARSVGEGADILRSLEWWTLTPRSDLVVPRQTPEDRFAPYAGELADGTRIVYVPSLAFYSGSVTLRDAGSDPWRVHYVDLGPARAYPEFVATPDADGTVDLDLGMLVRPSWGDILVIARPATS